MLNGAVGVGRYAPKAGVSASSMSSVWMVFIPTLLASVQDWVQLKG